MGPLGARPGRKKRHLEGKVRFLRFLWKNAIAGIFGEVTAIANRNGVQAKRAFCERRRDICAFNILTTENSTDSGDGPKNAFFPMVLPACPAPYVTFLFFQRCVQKTHVFAGKAAIFHRRRKCGKKPARHQKQGLNGLFWTRTHTGILLLAGRRVAVGSLQRTAAAALACRVCAQAVRAACWRA
jgi:hypothetical protein